MGPTVECFADRYEKPSWERDMKVQEFARRWWIPAVAVALVAVAAVFLMRGKTTENGMRVGDVGVVLDGTGLGGSAAAKNPLDLLTFSLSLKVDQEKAIEMVKEKRGFNIPTGSVVRIEKIDRDSCLVDVLDGASRGGELWVSGRFIVPRK